LIYPAGIHGDGIWFGIITVNDENIIDIGINILSTIKVSEMLDVYIIIRGKLAIIFIVISFSCLRTDDPEIVRLSL